MKLVKLTLKNNNIFKRIDQLSFSENKYPAISMASGGGGEQGGMLSFACSDGEQ